MSGPSLKSIIPALAFTVGMTPAGLYERQRALVRARLIKAERGRGPGSGVRATPESLAMLLISLLATDSLSEVESRTKAVALLKSKETSKRCPLTGQATFAAAVSAILGSDDIADRVLGVSVEHTKHGTGAGFAFVKDPKIKSLLRNVQHSEFGSLPDLRGVGLRSRRSLVLSFKGLASIIRGDN
jgi:hypothetical protein